MENKRNFYRKLFRVALPITLQSLIVSSLNMIDTFLVGKLGEKAVAAVGIGNQFFFLLSLIFFGISGGCSMYLSQYWGKKDKDSIKRIVGVGVITVVAVGILFMFIALIFPKYIVMIFSRDKEVIDIAASFLRIVSLSYVFTGITLILSSTLKCMEKTLVPMLVSLCAVIINIVLNFVLIFGLYGFNAYGVNGSAMATVIARIIECTIIIFLTFNRKSIIHGKFKEFVDFNKGYYFKIIKDVLPVVVNESCWALATISYSIAYGFIGTGAQASIQICNTIQNLFMVITFGVANGSLVMIGNVVGSGDEKGAKEYAKRFYFISILIGVILGLTMTLLAPTILNYFAVSPEVVASSISILIVMSLIAPFRVFNIVVVVGILRGGGDIKNAMYIEVSTMWLVGVPMAFLGALVFKLPVSTVVALTCLEEVAKFILCAIRLKSNKWIRNVAV